jgi:hypothetical protein
VTTFAGGSGSPTHGGRGFGAGEDNMSVWAAFDLAAATSRHGRIAATIVTTLPADVTILVQRGRRVIARARRHVSAGRDELRVPVRLPPGDYSVRCTGRGPQGPIGKSRTVTVHVRR